jgi:flavin reductase (DIM6/NTAB) family NADH-FMN oxidoreductase RutF
VLIDPAIAPVTDVYHALTGLVTPRPIAWVTTLGPGDVVNLAPFSFFNAFGANPPVVVFSPTRRRDGSAKDTLLNVERTGEFVVNAAVAELSDCVNLSSKELPPDQSELTLTCLTTRPSTMVAPPRLVESPAALECRVRQIIPIGEGPIAANLVIGEVVAIQIDDSILDEQGRIDPDKLATIGRLGGDLYCRTSDRFALKRP